MMVLKKEIRSAWTVLISDEMKRTQYVRVVVLRIRLNIFVLRTKENIFFTVA